MVCSPEFPGFSGCSGSAVMPGSLDSGGAAVPPPGCPDVPGSGREGSSLGWEGSSGPEPEPELPPEPTLPPVEDLTADGGAAA